MKQFNLFKWLIVASSVLLMSFASLHKFYLSVSEVTYSEPDQKLRVVSRLFIDDLDAVLLERYEVDSKLTTKFEHKMADFYLEKYIREKLVIKANDSVLNFNILGHKVNNDQMVFFIEANLQIDALKSLFVQNEILMDIFEEQQNIVHIKLKDKKKSFMLIRERSSGLLKF
jgi:hypothetical protein